MNEVLNCLIALGILLAAAGFGFVFGYSAGRASAREWVKKNCCYLCNERWRYYGTLHQDDGPRDYV